MPEKILQSEFYIFLVKIIFPAFLAVGVKIAIEMKKNRSKISMLNVGLSMLIGVGGAYLSSGLVQKNCDEEYVSVVIALIAITSEKIGEFLIYKLKVELFLSAFADVILDTILKNRGK
jgi:hypothetical protein